jgi:DNA-binding response OmpR family regulator
MRVQPSAFGHWRNSALESQHSFEHRQDQIADNSGEAPIPFRTFVVYPGSRTLSHHGCPVALGSRGFDLLMVLLRARGSVLTKDEILNHVWPSTIVEESNLRFQMACLRKALGKDRDLIKTIPGRGYLFATDTCTEELERHSLSKAVSTAGAVSSLHSSTSSDNSTSADIEANRLHSTTRSDVVIIDDDDDTRVALQSLLRSTGLSVGSFASVQAFLNAPPLHSPRCMVLDVWMPGQSGLDFFAELAEASTSPPVIFISGHADIHMSVRAMKSGAIDFLTKPVRYRDLLDAIQTAIER